MSVKLLALDTSTEACSVALLTENQLIERYEIAPRQHSSLILPMMQSVLAEAEIKLSQLDVIAFGRGPGSFTGVRMAASVVQATAFAHDLPVIPVSTLQALAQQAYREQEANRVVAAIDARMNEIYIADFILNAEKLMELVGAETVCEPAEFHAFPATDFIGIGSGWDSYQHVLQSKADKVLQSWLPACYPNASDIAVIALNAYQQNKFVSAEKALPVYLRDKVTQ